MHIASVSLIAPIRYHLLDKAVGSFFETACKELGLYTTKVHHVGRFIWISFRHNQFLELIRLLSSASYSCPRMRCRTHGDLALLFVEDRVTASTREQLVAEIERQEHGLSPCLCCMVLCRWRTPHVWLGSIRPRSQCVGGMLPVQWCYRHVLELSKTKRGR